MYEAHFGLRRRPFPTTPDAGCYYPASRHEQALEALLLALTDGEGVVLLTGTPGVGKTLLGLCLIEGLGPDVASAFLTHATMRDRAGLLQALLFDLGLPYQGLSEEDMRLALMQHLLAGFAE
jgi:type II secretory pathway predicted ATPase ExeA